MKLEEIDFSELSDDELNGLFDLFMEAFRIRQQKRDAEQQAKLAAEAYAEAVKEEPPRVLEDLKHTDVVGPSGRIVIDGKVWKNVSGTWLSPFTAGPDQYPQGWARDDITGEEKTAPAWRAGVEYKTGDEATFENTVFKCIQAHTSQAGWEPSNVPALWARK